MDEYNSILEQARQLVDERRPDASPQKKAAFANSVAYLVTGFSGGFGGPSVREPVASWTYGPGGSRSFDEATHLLLAEDGVIFGPITDVHRQIWQDEHCFDDDPDDLAELS